MQKALELVMRVHEDSSRQRDFATMEAQRLGSLTAHFRERISSLESDAGAMRLDIEAQLQELEQAREIVASLREDAERKRDIEADLRERVSGLEEGAEVMLIKIEKQDKEIEESRDATRKLAFLQASLDAALLAADLAGTESVACAKRIAALEDDARDMRKISNLVALEKKLVDLQHENESMKKSLATKRTASASAGFRKQPRVKSPLKRVPDPEPDTVDTPEPELEPVPVETPEPETEPEPLKSKTIKGTKYLANKSELYSVGPDGTRGDRVALLSKDDKGRTKIEWH